MNMFTQHRKTSLGDGIDMLFSSFSDLFSFLFMCICLCEGRGMEREEGNTPRALPKGDISWLRPTESISRNQRMRPCICLLDPACPFTNSPFSVFQLKRSLLAMDRSSLLVGDS